MNDQDGFAAFMAGQRGAVVERLKRGQRVAGTVSHIGSDSVFVALGTRADGRVPRVELLARDGQLRVAIGDPLEATVVDPDAPEGPLLAVTLGKDQTVDLQALQLALQTKTPVQVQFARAVKGGLEAELDGATAFCPASQVDTRYVADLTSYVGKDATVLVLEIKGDGRSVVVSRRAALELERAAAAAAVRAQLRVGSEVEGTIVALKPYGAFVDLGGVEGLLHVSEVGAGRIERLEDVLSLGEQVKVRVLDLAGAGDDTRIRLSMRDHAAEAGVRAAALPGREEVLKAKVVRLLPHGVLVHTEKGEGLVPKRELGLPVGADHRRAIRADQELEVALLDGASGRLRFSVSRVQEVRASQDFQAYQERQRTPGQGGAGMSSLGAQLEKLSLGPLPSVKARPTPPSLPKTGADVQTKNSEPPSERDLTAGGDRGAAPLPAASPRSQDPRPAAAPPALEASAAAEPDSASRRRRIVRPR